MFWKKVSKWAEIDEDGEERGGEIQMGSFKVIFIRVTSHEKSREGSKMFFFQEFENLPPPLHFPRYKKSNKKKRAKELGSGGNQNKFVFVIRSFLIFLQWYQKCSKFLTLWFFEIIYSQFFHLLGYIQLF